MISAEQLSKRYEDGVLALDSLDLHVGTGEIYCLLGANGAGKTTTIDLFLGFIEPSSGTASLNGVVVHERPLVAKQFVGYLSENVKLYGNLTARQNLGFFSQLFGRGRIDRGEANEVLLRVGLPEGAIDRPVKTFSKGMRQKLGIAIVMIKDAPALLLDEPTSGLDPKAAAELVETLAALRDRGKAILMATHDIFRARELADRLGIMKGGVKVAELTRVELGAVDLEQLYLEHMRAPAGDRGSWDVADLLQPRSV